RSSSEWLMVSETRLTSSLKSAPRSPEIYDEPFFLVWKGAGYGGISLFKGLLLSATAGILVWTARLRGSSWPAILCCLPLFLLTSAGWLARPQLWTFLGFSIFVCLLEYHRKAGSLRLLWLPPLAVLWANLHAGFILSFALLAAYLVGEPGALVNRWSRLGRKEYLLLWVVLAGLVLAAFLTPYPEQFFRTLVASPNLGAAQSESGKAVGAFTALFNMDWRPTTFRQDRWFYYALGLGASWMLLGWRRFNLTDFCLLAGLSLMGLKLSRHTSFLFFALVAFLPAYLDTAVMPVVRMVGEKGRHFGVAVIAVLAATAMIWLARPIVTTAGFFDLGLREWHYPVRATEFIRQQRLPGNLYNTYDWGGYLAWKLYPRYKVFWDGRQDDAAMFRQGWRVMAGKEDWQAILDRHRVNVVVTRCLTMDTGQRYPLLDRLEQSDQWALVYADNWSLVFVRKKAVADDWLQKYRLDKARIWQTLYSEARLSVAENRWRYKAWWEMARLDLRQRRYAEALNHLEEYLSRSPQGDPVAENYYRMLYPLIRGKGNRDGH
ncbi:hypothetical protein EDC39_1151, partial [Geothermobacter ehrlichii]